MDEQLKKQIEEFREKTEKFSKGEINVAEYKSFSGKFGSYAQRGAKTGMLRLRLAGGQLSKEKFKSLIDLCEKYDINHIHCTTCQTFQLHDLPFNIIADVITDAIENGFYCIGGGGDFPRNVMVSPLSGVEKDENFDVFPYAQKAADYLISQIETVKMPRKLKVCFSNSPANAVHATFRDLGFVSRPDGKFDVYCAGGMGANPRMGVKIAEKTDGTQVLYYVKAMISFFCKYGNYEVRSKARTRYIQEELGDEFTEKFNIELHKALDEGGLDCNITENKVTKIGCKAEINSRRIIEQKQKGLYAVKFHPIGGILNVNILKDLFNTIRDMPDVSLRISPDETIYIINCDGMEAQEVLKATECSAKTDIEESVACIGASICQQGLRDSQELLKQIIEKVKPFNFPADALPVLHISGCRSSCGTHQIGKIGFHGKVKMIDKKPLPGFAVSISGNDEQGNENFGEELGVMASDDIPEFVIELGKAVTESGMDYEKFASEKESVLREIINKYV